MKIIIVKEDPRKNRAKRSTRRKARKGKKKGWAHILAVLERIMNLIGLALVAILITLVIAALIIAFFGL